MKIALGLDSKTVLKLWVQLLILFIILIVNNDLNIEIRQYEAIKLLRILTYREYSPSVSSCLTQLSSLFKHGLMQKQATAWDLTKCNFDTSLVWFTFE